MAIMIEANRLSSLLALDVYYCLIDIQRHEIRKCVCYDSSCHVSSSVAVHGFKIS